MDFFFIIALSLAIDHAMKKHGGWKDGMGGLGGFIGLCIASAIGIAFIRIPVYLLLYGWQFPFNPSPTVAFVTGAVSILFWWSMIWWQVPARLLGRKLSDHKDDN